MSSMGRVLLINPRITSRPHARFPLSIMTMAGALEGRYDSTLIDGNMDNGWQPFVVTKLQERRTR